MISGISNSMPQNRIPVIKQQPNFKGAIFVDEKELAFFDKANLIDKIRIFRHFGIVDKCNLTPLSFFCKPENQQKEEKFIEYLKDENIPYSHKKDIKTVEHFDEEVTKYKLFS